MLSRTATRISPLSILSAANATTFADQMVSSTMSNPLDNRSKLIGLVSSNVIAQAGDVDKLSRETAIRALAEVGQTRTWNFLVDVISQTGKMVGGTASANFQVEAERRYWLHVAVDRFTGRVIDQELEPIND
jgi:putative salt-induced outer membrane protein YdiY